MAGETEYVTGRTIGAFDTSSFDSSASAIRGAIVVLPAQRATWAFYYDEPLHLATFDGKARYVAPDVTELRAGVEYRLPSRIPVALRAGWWHEPRHRAQASGTSVFARTLNYVLLVDSDENHVTAGIGVGDRVRLDAAVDRSQHTTRASLAVATTF